MVVLRLPEHVDESGGDDLAACIDGARAWHGAEMPMEAILPARIPISPEYRGEPCRR